MNRTHNGVRIRRPAEIVRWVMTDPSSRALQWLVVSFTGAGLTAATYITMIWWEAHRNPNDMTYGRPLLFWFLDPFVITVAAPIVIISAISAFGFAYLWLDTTVIWKTAALIYTVVLLEILLVGARDMDQALYLAYMDQALYLAYPALLAGAVVSKVMFRRPPCP